MKKLFNYALLAAALLVGVNVNAVNVAKIGTQEYETLQEAFDAATDGQTIELMAAASIDSYDLSDGRKITLDFAGLDLTTETRIAITHGELVLTGEGTYHAKGGGFCIKGSDDVNQIDDYSVLRIGQNITVDAAAYEQYGVNITYKSGTKMSQGAKLVVDGTILSQWFAVTVNGTVSHKEGKVPEIYVNATGKLQDVGLGDGYCGIYNAGYAKVYVYGQVSGETGIYMKAGELVVGGDAWVYSTSNTYGPANPYDNGVDGSAGSAIVLDSKNGYAGNISITITDNATIEGAGGYAIEETKTDALTSKTDAVVIESGTILGGDQGGLSTTAEIKQDIIDNGTITGGNFDTDITDYLGTNNIITPVTNDDGSVTYVIGTKDPEIPWKNDITTADEGDYVKVLTGENQELTEDVKAEYLVQEGTATITVPKDVTLTVGEIVMSKDARIIVEPGAKLIVEGNKGIVANNMENIVIETSSEKAGVLLLDPDVTSNKTPKATVRFYSKAFGKSEMVQLFGCPMVQVDKIEISNTDYKAQFDVWRKNAWDRIGVLNGSGLDYSKFDLPFGLYCITSNNPSGKLLYYDFTGSILGNSQPASLNLGNGYISIANSWTGMMDTEAIIKKLIAIAKEHADLQASIYMYTQTGTTLTWEGKSLADLGEEDIKPMEAIMILNEGSGFNSDLLSYQNLVFDPATKGNAPGAPAAKVWDKASIRIAAENQVSDRAVIVEADQFSSDFENGYDTKKYMNEEVCVYVNADNKYDIYATDDVNNTFVGFNCKNAGKFIVSFEGVTGNFALVDTKTNARIEMSEGNTYEFLAEAGEDAYRFQIVEAAKAPTNTPATKAAVKATKALINDQIVINNGERFFNMLGTDVK